MNEDPLITELRRFVWTWSEPDPDCPAPTLGGPAVMDPANCTGGLTVRLQQILEKVAARLAPSN